jgi:hypothetical protein
MPVMPSDLMHPPIRKILAWGFVPSVVNIG